MGRPCARATTNLDLTCPLDATGTHTIVVSDNTGDQSGNYRIAIRRLDSTSGCTLLTFGAAPTSGTIGAAAEMDCFRFSGAARRHGPFRATKTSGTLDARSTRCWSVPMGRRSRRRCCQIDITGTHKIIVGDLVGTGTGDYRISIQRLNNPVGCTPLGLDGSPLAGTVEPGEMDCYTLTGSVADRIQVHAIAAESDDFLSLDLFRPNGTLVSDGGSFICSEGSDFSLAVNLACPLDTAGTHTLIVEANIFTTNYSVSAQRSNNPAGCTAISFGGGPSTGSFVDAEMDCYTFSAAAGDQVRVRRFGTSGATHVEALVFGPDGDPVNCFDATERTCAIDTTGTYTILVRDDPFIGLETGTYALAIQRLNNPVGCTPLSFGAAPFVGSITAAAEIDCYAFSGAPGDQIQIALPVTSSSGARTGDVFDPNGDVVCSVTP